MSTPIDYIALEQDANPTYTRPEDWSRNLDVPMYGAGPVIDPSSGRVTYPTVAKLGVYDQLKHDLGVSGTTLGMTAAIIGLVVFISVFKK